MYVFLGGITAGGSTREVRSCASNAVNCEKRLLIFHEYSVQPA